MPSTSQLGAVFVAFSDQLKSRGGLRDVDIFRFGPSKVEDLGREHIVLCVSLTVETTRPVNNVRNRLENATIVGVVSARSLGESTDGDEETQSAMNRALEIYGELENQLVDDHQVDGTATWLLMQSAEHNYYTDSLSRIYQIKFTLALTTQLN